MYVNRGWSLIVGEMFTYTITATVSTDREILFQHHYIYSECTLGNIIVWAPHTHVNLPIDERQVRDYTW